MSEDIEIDADWVARKVKKLQDFIADDAEVDGHEESILDKVFDEDELVQLEDDFPILHGALLRVADDYDKATESDANLEQSQQGLAAIAENMLLRADADEGDDDDKDAAEKKKPAERD